MSPEELEAEVMTTNQQQGLEQLLGAAFFYQEVDVTALKCVTAAIIGRIKDHGNGKPASRELSLAVTKLQEVTFWIDEHQRLS